MKLKRIKQSILVLVVLLMGGLSLMPAVSADFTGDACKGISVVNGGSDTSGCTSSSTKSVSKIIKLVINVLSVMVGFTAVIMIIVGGFRYITSSGDSGKISAARNTIQYALIGLVIVAIAQVLVFFVLSKANCVATNNTTSKACKK